MSIKEFAEHTCWGTNAATSEAQGRSKTTEGMQCTPIARTLIQLDRTLNVYTFLKCMRQHFNATDKPLAATRHSCAPQCYKL